MPLPRGLLCVLQQSIDYTVRLSILSGQMPLLFDRGEFSPPVELPNGFVRADSLPTRTGVLAYRMADGRIVKHLRPASEVFDEKSLATLRMVKLTNGHPEPAGLPVTIDNAKTLGVGTVGADVRPHGDFVRATIQIEDAEAIEFAKSRGRRELSCGYNADFDMTPGIHDGEAYDLVQRNIRYNHVAIVDEGRAGPDAKMLLDSGATVMVEQGKSTQDTTPRGSNMTFKLTVDGVDYPVESQSLVQAVQQETARKDAEVAKLTADAIDAVKLFDKEKARGDALSTDLEKQKKLVEDAQDPKRTRDAVKARVELERKGAELLKGDDKVTVDSMSDAEIKAAVIKKHDADVVLTDRSDDYIQARYDAACVSLSSGTTTNLDNVQRAAGSPAVVVDGADAEKAKAEFEKFTNEAHKQRLNK